MDECMAIGDSIAVGLSWVTHCKQVAQVGRTTAKQAAIVTKLKTGTAVISLGSNDPMNPNLVRDLRTVRAAVEASFVVWIVPYHRNAATAVRAVARAYGDGIIELRNYPSWDWVHPQNYADIAGAIPNLRLE